MYDWGYVRVTAASHAVQVADPLSNAAGILKFLAGVPSSKVVVFGELSLSGYTCGDLFGQDVLLKACLQSLERLAESSRDHRQIVVVGLPLKAFDRLYNVAAVVHAGSVVGLVPKQYLPNYQEFYEARWFTAADGNEPPTLDLGSLGEVPFGIDLLFELDKLRIGIEICEDLWMPVPPSSFQAVAGANLILNLSASNELVGKADWRRLLVRSQSGRCLAAYAYASAGPSESTTDLVFGGHCMVSENGILLAESDRVGSSSTQIVETTSATADIDLERLNHDRRLTTSWQIASQRLNRKFRILRLPSLDATEFKQSRAITGTLKSPVDTQSLPGGLRRIESRPFVPKDLATLHDRCREIFAIQCAGLAKRVGRLPAGSPLYIGVSGGLDSSLALLVAVQTCQRYGWPTRRVHGLTMPGFGTSQGSLMAARTLARELNIEFSEIDIRQTCFETFQAIDHSPLGISIEGASLKDFEKLLSDSNNRQQQDLVFENVQARIRTLLLMSRGFVLGTGDLSEQALGWSTYNGDHMSMYNVNTSVPKTLVRFLIEYLAHYVFQPPVSDCLLKIAATPISPELLPVSQDGTVTQKTEESIGSYELHDFFLYHMVRYGASPRKILYMACRAEFSAKFEAAEIRRTLETFLKRFFANQFKRSCVPDGPKVGSVSLSPRGDWRMPSDAEVAAWLADLD